MYDLQAFAILMPDNSISLYADDTFLTIIGDTWTTGQLKMNSYLSMASAKFLINYP